MSLNYEKYMKKEIYDKAVYIGSKLRYVNVDKTTIANIISTFQSVADPQEACLLLMMYIVRQSGRKQIAKWVANELINHLKEIYDSFKNDKEKLREATNKFLILTKWVHESGVRKELKNFEEFIKFRY